MLTPAPIPDLDTQFSRTRRKISILLGLVCVGAFFSSEASFLLGVSVGLAVGLLNAFFLTNRLKKMVLLETPKAKGFMSQGFAMRFILIVVVLYVASNLSWLNLFGVGTGLLLAPLVTVFDLAICSIKEAMASQAMQVSQKSNTEGGENV